MNRLRREATTFLSASLGLALLAAPAIAGGVPDKPGETWDLLQAELWPGEEIADGDAIIDMDAPKRAADAAIVP
ncbi:MAG: quinoprotein dehydrogenase-associated SoxYZ-like carrier, partial [Pseudomonadota bacterium]